jgi:uncharacterized membrane protein YhaH (DUF805 family)
MEAPMTFAEATRYCFSHLTDFNGRGRRAEFWWYYLALQILSMVVMMVMMVVFFVVMAGTLTAASAASTSDDTATTVAGILGMGIWFVVYFLTILALNFLFVAAHVRRLHDVGQSGHWMWLALAGLGLIPLIMCIQDGQPYPNQWGPDPKAAERAAMPQYAVPGYAAQGYAAPGYAAQGYAAPPYAAPPAPPAPAAPPAPPEPPAV